MEFDFDGTVHETRETYLAWVDQWKIDYDWLSNSIRELRGMRKQNRYEYRDRGIPNPTVKRRTKIGENPNWDDDAQWTCSMFSEIACKMMHARMEAKEASKAHRLRLQEEAA